MDILKQKTKDFELIELNLHTHTSSGTLTSKF